MTGSERVSTMRLYGAAIAIVSGAYSAFVPVSGTGMTAGGWFMLALGAVVLVHGVVLLTPAAARLGTASGPLMLGYAALMLLNQLRLAAGWTTMGTGGTGGAGMGGGMGGTGMDGMGSTAVTAAMGADAGMVAIALLMLASGLVMTVRRDMMPASE
jgi:hypothetical protein